MHNLLVTVFLNLKKIFFTDTAREIYTDEGVESVSERMARFWFQWFSTEDFSLKDKTCAERPCTLISEAACQAIMNQIHAQAPKNCQMSWE